MLTSDGANSSFVLYPASDCCRAARRRGVVRERPARQNEHARLPVADDGASLLQRPLLDRAPPVRRLRRRRRAAVAVRGGSRQPRGRQPSPLRRQPPYAPKLRSPAPSGQGVGLKFGLSPPAAGAAARFGVRRAPRGINTIWNVARAPCGGWRRRLGLAGARNERHRRHPRLAFSSPARAVENRWE